MIVFLTLCYVAVLFLLVKVNIIKLNLYWKLSPIAWMLLLIIVLLIPMQWGAPSGAVNVYQHIVEIVPEVTGRVTEVPVSPLQPLKKGDVLFKIERSPFEHKVAGIEASLKLAKINLQRAKKLAKNSFAAKVTVDQYTAEIGSLEAQLDDAQYNLEHTVVRAPAGGYVVGLSLTPGQRVSNTPGRGWVTFVNSDSSRLVIGISQSTSRNIRTGQEAEVTFKLLPGQIINATVLSISPVTPQAQLSASGTVPNAPSEQDPAELFSVILQLEENVFEQAGLSSLDISSIPGGASGVGAIYTESGKLTHVIRKVMLRMDAWLNYLI